MSEMKRKADHTSTRCSSFVSSAIVDPVYTTALILSKGGLNAGSVFAAVFFPIIILLAGIFVYVRWARAKQAKKRQRSVFLFFPFVSFRYRVANLRSSSKANLPFSLPRHRSLKDVAKLSVRPLFPRTRSLLAPPLVSRLTHPLLPHFPSLFRLHRQPNVRHLHLLEPSLPRSSQIRLLSREPSNPSRFCLLYLRRSTFPILKYLPLSPSTPQHPRNVPNPLRSTCHLRLPRNGRTTSFESLVRFRRYAQQPSFIR